jgi:hypothetical protein
MERNYLDKSSAFLDVTAQICRLLGDRDSKQRMMTVVEEFLQAGGKKLLTSSVVYAQFLDTLVKDIIRLRDLVKKHFLDRMEFQLTLKDLQAIVKEADFPGLTEAGKSSLRKRLQLLGETLEAKYSSGTSVETKRVLRFLDSYARNLVFRDFLKMRIDGKIIAVKYVDPDIECTAQEPLQIDCNNKKDRNCVLGIYFDRGIHSKCLSGKARVINCDLGEITCPVIGKFVNGNAKKKATKKFILLSDEAKKDLPFDQDFRETYEEWIEFLSELTSDCSNLTGSKCYEYFLDVLILILCPDNAFILSRKKSFEDLGRAINRPDILVDF